MDDAHELPLRFRVPPGWPDPPRDWLVRRQGWAPPPGWTPPTAGSGRLAPAPPGWRFWTTNGSAWRRAAAPIVRPALRRLLVASAVVIAATGVTLVGAVASLTLLDLAGIGILIALVRVLTGVPELIDARRLAWTAVVDQAAATREATDRAAYARYLEHFEAGA